MLILGNLMSDSLTWDKHIKQVLIPALTNKLRTLRLVNKYLDPGFKAIFTNSSFRSTLMFGLETWGGAAKTLVSKVQLLQNQASKLALPRQYKYKTSRQRQNILGWLNIEDEVKRATFVQTFKILNFKKPQELASVMGMNNKNSKN